MNDFNRAFFPPVFPASWASEWGEDCFGLFMDLETQNVRQRFRWISKGTFKMGSPETETERDSDETLHDVTLTQGFWLADSACKQALWMTMMGENPSRFQDNPNNPVEMVSWDDVQQFLVRLNAAAPGLAARLPTEAEWEYACRAGTETPFSFGENISPEQVNYDGNQPYTNGTKGLYREKTIPIKSLPPNPWGLYEMHGNVWEWCADWYGDYEAGPVVDPTGPAQGSLRVVRGGSWVSLGWRVRSAYRFSFDPADRDISIGFRLTLGRISASGLAD
jgi:sulfatase modifying factor 1